MDYKIISVESRKGGVGKTTAALNLSDLLIKKEYNILLLDVDITGTSIAGSYNSSFWKDKIHPIKLNDEKVNLLKIFHNTFMKGEKNPEFSIDDKKDNFLLKCGTINVFDSEIYNDDNATLICDPRILFDELHSFWLIEMIESLCNSFYRTMKEKEEKKVAIILDNSPGYVGLGKAIHNWLTDIGPEQGKFLTVSSLDVQDLNSCISSIQAIDNIVTQKIQGAEYYNILKNNKNKLDKELSKESNNFFLKLATIKSEEQKYGYYKNDPIKEPELSYYQSIIINKAPKEIKSENLYYDINKSLGNYPKKLNVLKTFTGEEINESTKNIIYYDTYIHFQFVEPFIKRIEVNEKRKYSSLKRAFKIIEDETMQNKQLFNSEDHFGFNEEKNHLLNREDYYLEFINIIENYNKDLSTLLGKLEHNGFENIVTLIEERWYPLSQFSKMQQSFDNLCEEFPFNQQFSQFKYDNFNESLRGGFSAKEIMHIIENSIEFHRFKRKNLYYEKSLLYFLLTKKRTKIHSEMGNEFILSILKVILIIQNERFKMKDLKNNYKQNIRYQYFLANENLSSSEVSKYILFFEDVFNKPKKVLTTEIIHYFSRSDNFSKFYNSFCRSQARLIDINEDFLFLITLLKRVTVDERIDSEIIFPNIKDILDDVIIKKSKYAASAYEDINKELKRVQDMTMFREVLTECVIKKWEL